MNRLIRVVKELDAGALEALLDKEPRWVRWAEPSGKNALHYLCGIEVGDDAAKAERSFEMLRLLLDRGMDIDAVHAIPDDRTTFPATPLWYAYTRGRNEPLYTYLLERGAKPDNCMFAIAWNDDIAAAELFRKHGATIDNPVGDSTPFFAALTWRRFTVAEWFLQQGAGVNHRDIFGNTALYYGVKRRYGIEVLQMLLRHGADPDLENAEGVSPRGLAESVRRRSVLQLFEA